MLGERTEQRGLWEAWTADERFYRAASPSIANVRLIRDFVAPE